MQHRCGHREHIECEHSRVTLCTASCNNIHPVQQALRTHDHHAQAVVQLVVVAFFTFEKITTTSCTPVCA